MGDDTPAVNAKAIEARLKREDFDAVGRSLPDNFSDLGWFAPSQLMGTDYAPAVSLTPGSTTALIDETFRREFLHLEEIRPDEPCDLALARHPDDAFARSTRADWELRNGAYEAAIGDYTVALAIEPGSTNALYGRASAYYLLGVYAKAATDAGGVREEKGYALRAMAEMKLDESDLATYDAAQSGDPAILGAAYSNLGYFAAATEQFDLALKAHPGQAWALGARGFAHFSMGDLAGAADDFTASARAMPQGGYAFLALAVLRYSQGDLKAALIAAKRARAFAPHDPYASLWIRIAGGRLRGIPKPLAKGRCEADFYAAAYRRQIGETKVARRLLQSAVAECPYKETERAAALALLRRP